MKKRIVTLLLALTLCMGLLAPAAGVYAGYNDVPEDHWAAESIRRATEIGLFRGVDESNFGLGQPISRAAFVQALVRLFGWEDVVPANATFTDVSREKWYYAAVETAVANGAVVASGSVFRPEQSLNRGDMAAMIMRALAYTSLAGTVSNAESPFSDVTANKGFITMAYDMGIVGGIGDGKFAPSGTATREQAATILVRVYERLSAQSSKVTEIGEDAFIRVKTAPPVEGDELPTTPLEPITELYNALRQMKASGQNMGQVVLCLTGGGVRTTVSTAQGKIISTDTISAQQVQKMLERDNAHIYYSERYESAYFVYEPNTYQTVTVWYQSEESLAVKLQLAKMFGVTKYILE